MPSDHDRLTSAETVLMEANRIARTSRVSTARHAWVHLVEYGIVAAPKLSDDEETGAFQLLWKLNENEKLVPNPPLLILPIAKEDAALGLPYSKLWTLCSTHAFALYNPSGNLLVYRCESDETDFVRGCAILHEAGHAKRAFDDNRLGEVVEKITPAVLLEEVAMHTQDYQLWQARGGSAYIAAINTAVTSIQQGYNHLNHNRACVMLKSDGPWSQAIESTLGPAPTPKRRIARLWQFTIHAHFAYADQQPWSLEKKLEHKAMVMKLIYAHYVP